MFQWNTQIESIIYSKTAGHSNSCLGEDGTKLFRVVAETGEKRMGSNCKEVYILIEQ